MVTDTKTALLDSAERAACRHGFDGFSFADLATGVGIRKASVHHHFPTKADLSIALMHRYISTLETDLVAIDDSVPPPADRLLVYVDRYRASLCDGYAVCLCIALSVGRDHLDERVVSDLRRFRAINLTWLQRVFAEGINGGTIPRAGDPASEAASFLATIEGAQLAARAERNPARFDLAVALLRSRFE